MPIIASSDTEPALRLRALGQVRQQVLKEENIEQMRELPKLVKNLLVLTCSPNSVLREQAKSFLSMLNGM